MSSNGKHHDPRQTHVQQPGPLEPPHLPALEATLGCEVTVRGEKPWQRSFASPAAPASPSCLPSARSGPTGGSLTRATSLPPAACWPLAHCGSVPCDFSSTSSTSSSTSLSSSRCSSFLLS